MTFLPIVVRELQVAARRRSTFQLRFLTATGATLLGGLFLMVSTLPGALAATGRGLFVALTVALLGMALISGVVLTADCLSRERREGTLGFLFLTDLTGWDVVAGKLAALALVPFQAVLAVFPVAAMSLFLGGVTYGEFWRVLLVVLLGLWMSLTVGLWVSSRVTDDRQAVALSLLGMGALLGVPYLLGTVADLVPQLAVWSKVRVVGVIGLYEQAMDLRYRVGSGLFWVGSLIQWALGAVFLGLATWRVTRSWRVVEAEGVVRVRGSSRWMPAFGRRMVERQRARLRDEGNLAWLGWQGVGMRRAAWWTVLGAGGAATGTLVIALTQSPFAGEGVVGSMITMGFWVLKLLLAAHTVYFLHEIRRNGMLELLLVTPVAGVRMWNGHIAAVRGVFLWPFLVLSVLEVIFGIGVKVAKGGDWPSWAMIVLVGGLPAVVSSLINGLDCFAIAYHAGRWALHYDRPGKALLRTVVLVVVLPVVLCSYGRFLVDLLVIAAVSGELNRFRDLARNSFLPKSSEPVRRPPRLPG